MRQGFISFRFLLGILFVITGVCATFLFRGDSAKAAMQEKVWQELTAKVGEQSVPPIPGQAIGQRKLFRLNSGALQQVLTRAPREAGHGEGGAGQLSESQALLELPMPDGQLARFRIQESPLLESPLSDQYPDIKSYRGQGIDDPAATMRASWSSLGFHALILTEGKAVTVLPVTGDSTVYASSNGQELTDKVRCDVDDSKIIYRQSNGPQIPSAAVGNTLRTFRIAIATTADYSAQFGNSNVGQTIASINVWLNAANAIYERELSVRLNLIGNNSQVVYTAEPDPFTNGDSVAMLAQVRTTLRDQIGSANYDLGHVFGTGGAGLAYIGVACSPGGDSNGPFKGGGVSLMGGAAGNSTYVGLWTHEIGHQFGADHSYNGTAGFCNSIGGRNAASAYESGAGITLMSYAGVCDSDNLSLDRDLRFHAKSFDAITTYLANAGTCAQTSATGNNVPTINGGADFTIPKNTPFTLTATGGDADAGDVPNLRYIWEQYDAGSTNYANPPYEDSNDTSASTRPIFRPFSPVASPSRTFPSLTYILNNANNPPDFNGSGFRIAEKLPQIGRTLNFRATVRDQRGGVNFDDVQLQVAGNAGPFTVTGPESPVTWTGGTNQTVTWNVAGTNTSPVNCANVKISLSTDGGNTFPIVVTPSTPNDGSEVITVPAGSSSSMARIKIEAVGNVFFDISGVNFTLQPGSCTYSIDPTGQNVSGAGGSGTVTVTATAGCAWAATSNAGWVTITSGGTGSGNGSVAFTVATNTGVARNGTLTIAGQTFTVTQGGNCPAISLSPSTLSNGTVGAAYPSTTITASGGVAPHNYSFTGTLPPGLNLSAGGTLSGTPTVVGAYTFTVQALDINGCPGSQTYSLEISPIGLQFYPLPKPIRLLDTRAGQTGCDTPGTSIVGGSERTQLARRICDSVTIPANAMAITGNITPIPSATGFLTLYPSNANRPMVASANFSAGKIVNNMYTVGLGPDGSFKIYASATTDVVVDVSGYFAPPGTGGLYFHPLPTPIRLLETRQGQSGCDNPGVPLAAGSTRTQPGRVTCTGVTIPTAAQALVGNATVVGPSAQGFITLFPSDAQQPMVASGNYTAGSVVNTPFTVGLGADGAFKIFTTQTTDIVIDVLGYYSTQASDVNGAGNLFYSLGAPIRLLDSRMGATACHTPDAPFSGGVEYVQQAGGTCSGQTIPSNAAAVLGNVTAVSPPAGFLTLWPSNVTRPFTATSNFAAGQTANRHFIVGLGPDDAFKLYVSGTTELVIDLSGYFAP